MPALVVCGQNTGVAGDDLRIWCLFGIAARTVQICLIVPGMVLVYRIQATAQSQYCSTIGRSSASSASLLLDSYWSVSLLVVLSALVLEVAIWRTSIRGTPVQPERRKALIPLCYCKYGVHGVVRLAAFCLGCWLLSNAENFCDCESGKEPVPGIQFRGVDCPDEYDSAYTILFLFVWTQLFDVIGLLAAYLYLFCRCCRPQQKLYGCCFYSAARGGEGPEAAWRMTCRLFCTCSSVITCCLFGGRKAVLADFTDIAIALSDLTHDGGALDVAVSDILAGVLMVMREQKEKREQCRKTIMSSDDDDDDQDQDQDDVDEEQTTRHHGPVEDDDAVEEVDDEEDGLLYSSVEVTKKKKQHKHRECIIDYRMSRMSESFKLYYEAEHRMVLDATVPSERRVIAEGAHFVRLAISIYGYMLYVYDHMMTAPCMLAAGCMTCRPRSSSSCCCCCCCCCSTKDDTTAVVVNDQMCGLNEIAVLQQTGLDRDDIAFLSFRQGIIEQPYGIVIDRVWKSIVIVIRGTLSLEDAIADLSMQPAHMKDHLGALPAAGDDDDNGEEYYCHSGMLHTAEWIYKDLSKHGVLEKLLPSKKNMNKNKNKNKSSSAAAAAAAADATYAASAPQEQEQEEEEDYTDYRLRVIGHSLGAGVAAVLSILLRPQYPACRCLCFSPPGCVLTENLATTATSSNDNEKDEEELTISFVLNADIIPRLSIQSVENLRDDVLEMIARIKVPKHKILDGYVWKNHDRNETKEDEEEEEEEQQHQQEQEQQQQRRAGAGAGAARNDGNNVFLHPRENIPDTEFMRTLEECKNQRIRRRSSWGSTIDIPLVVPGKIVHLIPTNCSSSSSSSSSNNNNHSDKQQQEEGYSFRRDVFRFHPSKKTSTRKKRTTATATTTTRQNVSPYTPVWAERHDFAEIQLANSFLSDHMPASVAAALESIAQETFGLSKPYLDSNDTTAAGGGGGCGAAGATGSGASAAASAMTTDKVF